MTIRSYEQAQKFLAGGRNKLSRKSENNTWIEQRGENIAVRLHNTDVVLYKPDGGFVLDTGGWHSVTTKDRINGYAPHGVKVYSNDGIWSVYGTPPVKEGERYTDWANRSALCDFADGLEFDKEGKPVNPPASLRLQEKALQKAIKKYVDGFVALAMEKGIAYPSGGDCWGCHFEEMNAYRESGMRGRSLDVVKANPMGFDHYFGHFEEDYYVPSLLYKAFCYCGYGNSPQCGVWWPHVAEEQGDDKREWPGQRTMLARTLRRYFKAIKPHLLEEMVKRGGLNVKEQHA
jgi:hypothetical protein